MAARILVVDDDQNIQRLLSYTLRQAGYDVTIASDGAEGYKRWSQDRPDLLVLDVEVPKMDGFALTAKIRAEEGPGRHIPIIILTSEADVQAKVRGLRAGADDYQVKPFHPGELQARIKSLLVRFAPATGSVPRTAMGRVHAYYGAKGGVGTTTIAINAAIALQRELGRRVVLIDGNLQFGDHRVFLDLGLDSKSIVDVVTAPGIDADILKSVLVTHDSGIDLLLAPPSPETAELVSAEHHHMLQIIDVLRDMYDYVLIDIDKRLDETNLDAIGASDLFFVVMTADLSCLKNVRLVLETMSQLGIEQAKLQLLLNRSTAFTGINVKSAESALKRKIDYQVINEYRGAIGALNSGAPFMANKPDSPLGRSVREFVRNVDKRSQVAATEARQLLPGRPEPEPAGSR